MIWIWSLFKDLASIILAPFVFTIGAIMECCETEEEKARTAELMAEEKQARKDLVEFMQERQDAYLMDRD